MHEDKLLMSSGDWYLPDYPELDERDADMVRREGVCAAYNAAKTVDERRSILEQLLGSVGELVRIRAPFHCDYGYNIRLGNDTFVNFGAVFLDVAPITIGAHVRIGPNVQLLTPEHETGCGAATGRVVEGAADHDRRQRGWAEG